MLFERMGFSAFFKTENTIMNLTILTIILTLSYCWDANSERFLTFNTPIETNDIAIRNWTRSFTNKQDELDRRVRTIEQTHYAVSQIDYTICNSNKHYVGVLHDLRPEIVNFGLNFGARYCENGWTVIQRRGISGLDFNKPWEEYKRGFGSLSEDFWYGNDFIHALTNLHNLKLRIELEGFEGEKGYAEYDTFKVESENDDYKLHIGGYSGNVGDSLNSHNLRKFTTPEKYYCADHYKSGWWFTSCFMSNLNGIYYNTSQNNPEDWFGIAWHTWKEKVPSKASKMMVKPK